MIIPDLHYPFHDPKFIKVISKVISKVELNGGIVQLGDAVDWWQLSRFDKNPERKNTARDDLEMYREQMIKWARELSAGAQYHQLEGNHEDRLTRYIWGRAADISQLVKAVPEMLGFKEMNELTKVRFRWHPIRNYRSCVIGDTILHHGHFFNKHVAVGNLERYPQKLITGHTHRLQMAYSGSRWSCTLGHGSLEHITAHLPVPTGWTQAFGILVDNRGECSLEVVTVDNGRCIFRGAEL